MCFLWFANLLINGRYWQRAQLLFMRAHVTKRPKRLFQKGEFWATPWLTTTNCRTIGSVFFLTHHFILVRKQLYDFHVLCIYSYIFFWERIPFLRQMPQTRICNNLGHTTILGHLLPSTKSKVKSMNNSSFRGTSVIIKFSDFETRALSVCAVSHHFRQKNICVKTIFHLFLLGCCFIWSWFWQAFFPRKNKQNAI